MEILRKSALSIGFAYLLYRACATLIRRHLINKLTVLNEFSEIGTKSTRKTDKLRGTVVICGGSVAGLLAAKVCADHFENVTLVESEEWITTPDGYTGSHRKELKDKKRSHVAQYNSAHLVLPLLVETLTKWFPNFEEECEKMGSRIVPQRWDISISGITLVDPFSYVENGPRTMRITRSGFEPLLRRLVMNSCQNIQYLAGTVLGLEQAGDSKVITGVHVRTAQGKEVTIPAILAIGASSAGLRWLRELAEAERNEVAIKELNNLRLTYDPKLSYRTCDFDVPPELVPRLMEAGYPSDWDLSAVGWSDLPDPKIEKRLISIGRKDHNHLEILCGGWDVSDNIDGIEDIRSYISSIKVYQSLPAWLFRVLDLLEEYNVPVTITYGRLGTSIYIPYDKFEYMPQNFIAMGDSVMRLNPLKGIGCTKACVEALSLNGIFNKCHPQKGTQTDSLPQNFSRMFHAIQASRIEFNWSGHKAEDYAFDSTVPSKGDDPKKFGSFERVFGNWVIHASSKNKNVIPTLGYIRCYLAPPTDIFSPEILFNFLKAKLFHTSPFL